MLRYRAEVDGLRAVAVIPVILYHGGLTLFRGGFVGVDIFFVISGYLITSILVSEMRENKFSVLGFYERRARRILPSLFLVVSCCIPVALIWLDPFALKEFAQSIISISAFSSNIYFYFKTGYFDTLAELKPLLHTWSLAVEEQFYIVYPLILLIFFRRKKQTNLPIYAFLSLLFVLSLIASQWLVLKNPSSAYYLIQSRAWELMIGSCAAFLLSEKTPTPDKEHRARIGEVFSIAGLALVCYSIFFFSNATPFPGLCALVPTVGTFLIIVFASEGTITAKILSHRILVGIGLISYSAYLWHQPLLAFFRVILLRDPNYPEALAIFCATLLLAWGTYHFVETPFRKKRILRNQKRLLTASAAGLAVLIFCGALGQLNDGFPGRAKGYMRLAENYGLAEKCSGAPLDLAQCQTKSDPKVILWGDSHAMHLANALSITFSKAGLRQDTLSACPPIPDYRNAQRKALITCYEYNSRVKTWLSSLDRPQDYLIVLSSTWDLSTGDYRDDFIANIKFLKSKGFKVLFISSTPRHKLNETDRCLIMNVRHNGDFKNCDYPISESVNLQYFANMKRFCDSMQISYISLWDFLCDEKFCRISKDGVVLFRDDGHLSVESKGLLAAYLKSRVAADSRIAKWLN